MKLYSTKELIFCGSVLAFFVTALVYQVLTA